MFRFQVYLWFVLDDAYEISMVRKVQGANHPTDSTIYFIRQNKAFKIANG